MVLSVIGEGMPMIYNGQEAGNPKRLKFFEKDEITWRNYPNGELYKKTFSVEAQQFDVFELRTQRDDDARAKFKARQSLASFAATKRTR